MVRVLSSPRGKLERREGQDLSLFSGVAPRESKIRVGVLPGQHGARGAKLSPYGKQFRAKQMAKRIYGVHERQFRNYFKEASRRSGSTGENLLRLLEGRLDNVVFRSGFARTRREARQIVSHKLIQVVRGGVTRLVNIPSFQVRIGDVIVVREKARGHARILDAIEIAKQRNIPEWLDVDHADFKTLIRRQPDRNEMPTEIDELAIVELYSK